MTAIPTTERTAGSRGWLVSPAFDLLFLANVAWPLALLPGFLSASGRPHTEFWQIYFLTTPHRWITLFLVALDPDRRAGRGRLFVGLAVVAFVAVFGLQTLTGAFLCLALVDTLWNGWHFAAQHYGVLRVYSRQAGDAPRLEQLVLRPFLFYVTLRVAGFGLGWLSEWPDLRPIVQVFDFLALAVPVLLLGRALTSRIGNQSGRLTYLFSVCLLYGGLLLAVRAERGRWVVALAAASATFHATEYLALVTFYAWRRQDTGSDGVFRRMASRWVGLLAVFVVALGLVSLAAEASLRETWVGLNLCAAFLHYAYDGMIWKLRRPETARALGAAVAVKEAT